MNGYAGKVLHVNLTDGKIEIEEPPESFYRRYLGGNGFVGYYLLKEVPKGADPLGPDNALIFAAGTITVTNTGTPVYMLPETGGPGTQAVRLGGAALAAAAAGISLRRKKTRRYSARHGR